MNSYWQNSNFVFIPDFNLFCKLTPWCNINPQDTIYQNLIQTPLPIIDIAWSQTTDSTSNHQNQQTNYNLFDYQIGDTFTKEETNTKQKNKNNLQNHSTTKQSNKYDEIINKYAKEYGVDPNLIKAMIRQESKFNPDASSRAGAKGLMQLMPNTAKDLGVTDLYDPEQNIRGGVKYIKQLLNRYNGDIEKALAAYNWGMGNVDRKGLENAPKETKAYIPKVLNYYSEYCTA